MTSSTRTSSGQDTVASLRTRLARLEREAASRERQLEAYASDLREVFKQERLRAQELRRSYKATVLALANAVEARDAYTGRHAQRVAAYGLRIAHAAGVAVDSQVEFGFLLHDVGKVAVPGRDPVQARPADRRGARADDRAPHDRLGDPAPRRLPRRREDGGATSPRALGRAGLPGRAGGRGDPAARARVRARRRAGRAHQRPAVPRGRQLGEGAGGAPSRTPGTHFDPAIVAAYDTVPDEAFQRIREGIE